MTLTKSERAEVLQCVKEAATKEFLAEHGIWKVVTMDQARDFLGGLTKSEIRRRLPIVEISSQKHGVRMGDIKAYIEARTFAGHA